MTGATVREIPTDEALARVEELCEVLLDCIAGGASVSFMTDMTRDEARAFWRGVIEDAARGGRALIVAEIDNRIEGAAQAVLVATPNQPHRADIAKMLVHRRARGRGLGAMLLARAEQAANERGRWLMTLDTASDVAERLYERGGWTRVGVIPDYALLPDGGLCDTVVYYKKLPREGAPA